jgi:hypothetical protein
VLARLKLAGAADAMGSLAQRLMNGMKRAWDSTEKFPIAAKDIGWTTLPLALPPASHLNVPELEAALKGSVAAKVAGAASDLVWLKRCQAGHQIDLACLRLGGARVLHMPGVEGVLMDGMRRLLKDE